MKTLIATLDNQKLKAQLGEQTGKETHFTFNGVEYISEWGFRTDPNRVGRAISISPNDLRTQHIYLNENRTSPIVEVSKYGGENKWWASAPGIKEIGDKHHICAAMKALAKLRK